MPGGAEQGSAYNYGRLTPDSNGDETYLVLTEDNRQLVVRAIELLAVCVFFWLRNRIRETRRERE